MNEYINLANAIIAQAFKDAYFIKFNIRKKPEDFEDFMYKLRKWHRTKLEAFKFLNSNNFIIYDKELVRNIQCKIKRMKIYLSTYGIMWTKNILFKFSWEEEELEKLIQLCSELYEKEKNLSLCVGPQQKLT